MKVLQITAPGHHQIQDRPVPVPGQGQVLVKVLAVSTCPHWDLHIYGGEPMFPGGELHYPYAEGQPGHEACGEVVEVGPGVLGFQPGQWVCVWRDPGHHLPGCYAQYVVKDQGDLIPIPDGLPPEHWAPLELAMCMAAHVLLAQRLDLVKGKRTAVFGLGPSGLVCVQMLRAAGAREVVAVDPIQERREIAARLGATSALDPREEAFLKLPSRFEEGCIETSIDCVGHPEVVQRAMDLTQQLVVLFAVQRKPYTFAPSHWGRLILAGTQPHTFEAALYARDLIAQGKISLAPLVSRTMRLEDYGETVGLLKAQKAIKVAFLPQE
jgi:threonine dehydrogenase-like Zn-dependent dehydrogenase